MESVNFTYSDLVAGYVSSLDRNLGICHLRTSDGRPFSVKLKKNAYAQIIRNLDEPYIDCTAQMIDLLTPGRYVYTYGTYYPERDRQVFEAQFLVFAGRRADEFLFERRDWWVKQIKSLGDFYLKAQFVDGPVDYQNYRTTIKLTGEKAKDNYRQETDTISRLVYGFATAYMLTGDDRYLEGAEKGTEYLREHMRFYDARREHRLLVPRHRHPRRPRGQDLRLRVRRRLRRDPGLRADLRPRRARSRPTASPATRASSTTPR